MIQYGDFIAAVTIWREARGEPIEGMKAVAHVIVNRANAKGGDQPQVYNVCVAPWQFSSMTAMGDKQLGLWPKMDDPIFQQIMDIMLNVRAESDPTLGATHYFNPSVVLPTWASKMHKTVSIGHHDFYK